MTLRDSFGNSLLHIACLNGHLEVSIALMDAGADIDDKNENEETPLHLAATKGHIQ